MAHPLNLTLEGKNLGDRHRHLNSLVNSAAQDSVDFSYILTRPSNNPIDRIFKIDLAAEYRDLHFIFVSLKDEDMLYVSRALKKCSWLLHSDYQSYIYPRFLEELLYPDMTTKAVNKMKHWIEKNLKDPDRCEHFFCYYYNEGDLDSAMKFLHHCSETFIMWQMNDSEVLQRITTPQRLKMLCETSPHVATAFYYALKRNETILKNFNENKCDFYKCLFFLLKTRPDIFLEITEMYYFHFRITWSAEATKQMLIFHKERFYKKPELYIQCLDHKTLAKLLSQEEIKELILKLARAQFLNDWFCFENVATLIKAINANEREAFKKRVFVDKNVGKIVQNWPYDICFDPILRTSGKSIFEDVKIKYDWDWEERRLRARKLRGGGGPMRQTSNLFDELFHQYRFSGFEKTYAELKTKMTLAQSTDQRKNMMLLLVSKSGGRPDSLERLLTLLASRYKNETENMRATVIRSLVRRCSAWRLPQHVWQLLVSFGRGLGLDGAPAAADCREGLHAVIIRNILHDTQIDSALWKAYMENFSTLTEYSLTDVEKRKLTTGLLKLLTLSAKSDPENIVTYSERIFNVLIEHEYSENEEYYTLMLNTAQENPKAKSLLRRLFEHRVACKKLFAAYFEMTQVDASYLNALKHDTSVLASGKRFEALVQANELAHERFLKSLALYFNEDNGLAKQYLSLLLKYAEEAPKGKLLQRNLARSIAILSGEGIVDILKKFNQTPKKSERRQFSAQLRANAHLARPLMDIQDIPLEELGVKAVANRIMTCSTEHVEQNLDIVRDWPKAQKLALLLSTRIGAEQGLLNEFGKKSPKKTLKTILRFLKKNNLNDSAWPAIIRLIAKLDKIEPRLKETVLRADNIPENKIAKYFAACYRVRDLSHQSIFYTIANYTESFPEAFVKKLLLEFLKEEFSVKTWQDSQYIFVDRRKIQILAQYLLLCKTPAKLNTKWNAIGKPFFDRCEILFATGTKEKKSEILNVFSKFISALKYSLVILNPDYISCEPLILNISSRFNQILSPSYKYISWYLHVHFAASYFIAIRECMKNDPDETFDNLDENISEATKYAGNIFGQIVGYSAYEWSETYFDSIKEIYAKNLVKFLDRNFIHGDFRNKFVRNVIKGILECDKSWSHLLAERIYRKESGNWPRKSRLSIMAKLRRSGSMEMRFFLHHYNHIKK